MKQEITFKQANVTDIPLIRQMAGKIWSEHYISIITKEQTAYMLDKWYSPESLLQQMNEGQLFNLIYVKEKPVGFLSVHEKEPGHFFLAKFYLNVSLHRKGIGTVAFKQLKETLCKNYTTITLQVNRQNIKAINFYFKQGFVINKAFDFDIGNGFFMNDFIMKLKSPKP